MEQGTGATSPAAAHTVGLRFESADGSALVSVAGRKRLFQLRLAHSLVAARFRSKNPLGR
jgi:hypothetical protein